MSSIRIRPARDGDMPFFHEMEFETTWYSMSAQERELWPSQEVREGLKATIEALLARPGTAVFIAESESGEPVGVLWFGENRNLLTGEDEAWIYNISVIDAFRGKGVGGQLMAFAEAHAREAGYRSMGLMVAAHNEGARRFYQRLGFEEAHVLMRRRLE